MATIGPGGGAGRLSVPYGLGRSALGRATRRPGPPLLRLQPRPLLRLQPRFSFDDRGVPGSINPGGLMQGGAPMLAPEDLLAYLHQAGAGSTGAGPGGNVAGAAPPMDVGGLLGASQPNSQDIIRQRLAALLAPRGGRAAMAGMGQAATPHPLQLAGIFGGMVPHNFHAAMAALRPQPGLGAMRGMGAAARRSAGVQHAHQNSLQMAASMVPRLNKLFV